MTTVLITLDEVATRLGKSKEWVYRQCLTGKMPHRRFGNTRMLTETDLAEFIDRAKIRDPWARSPQSRARRKRSA